MTWTQNYTPLGNLYLSALVAAIPVVVLLGSLAFFHVKAHVAALLGLVAALLVAFFVYHMPPSLAVAAAFNGALFGMLPIGWIVLNAIFLYDISVTTGEFENVKHTIAGLASDRRVQILLIGFSFGAFIEGASGFGTPVAICGAMLIGLGFKPLAAAGLALIGNTAPVAYGALGTPVVTLAKVTGLPVEKLSAMVGRQLPFFSVLVPFWLVAAMSGMKGMAEVWPACLVAGVFFAIPQFLVSNFIGPELVDIIAAAVSILAVYVLLKFSSGQGHPDQGHHQRGLEGVDALDHPLGLGLHLGLLQGGAGQGQQPHLEPSLAPQPCPEGAAAGAQAHP
jgi:lactate permease